LTEVVTTKRILHRRRFSAPQFNKYLFTIFIYNYILYFMIAISLEID